MKDFIVWKHGPVIAKLLGVPFIKWRIPSTGVYADEEKDPDTLTALYDANPQLWGYFIQGCHAYLVEKINNNIDLCNGSEVIMHSITFATSNHLRDNDFCDFDADNFEPEDGNSNSKWNPWSRSDY